MRKQLLLISVIFHSYVYGQTLQNENFITYAEVIKELESSENIPGLADKYNFTSILLLDSTKIDLIEKTGIYYISDFRDYVSGLSLSDQTIGFVTEKRDIKDVFKDKNSLNRILTCINSINSPDIPMTQFDFPIYIKENTAIFETFGPTWSDIYYASLTNGVLQVNWLGGIIE